MVRHKLANSAKSYDWPAVLQILDQYPSFINAWRLGGKSWYTPLHQAAHGGAPAEIAQELVERGAWRTLPTANGERPYDIALRRGHHHLLPLLSPVYKHHVPLEILAKLQANFHTVIRVRAEALIAKYKLRLPELEPLLEIEEPIMLFTVPEMYGGFNYWLEASGPNAKLISHSWSRVVGGSGQYHMITSEGSQLMDKELL